MTAGSLTSTLPARPPTAFEQMVRVFAQPDTAGTQRLGIPAPDEWEPWLRRMFPKAIGSFADHHRVFWEYIQSIRAGVRPRPFIASWARGGGKSTSCELGVTFLALRGERKYCLYVRRTQEQADKSVANIAALLEAESVEQHYPAHAERLLSKYGQSKGWRRNRLRTNGGFTIDAIGLDTAARGVKVEDQRPDIIIFDDIDEKHDSPAATQKLIETLTASLFPAGSIDCAIIGVQNLIIPNGVFSRLMDGRASFLADRITSGPHPAVLGLRTEPVMDSETGRIQHKIVSGTATWPGQDLATCQRQINAWGLRAFIEESQHQVQEREGALWTKLMLQDIHAPRPKVFKRIVVAMDPSATKTGDEVGLVVAGLGYDNDGYLLEDLSAKLSPNQWARAAVDAYYRHKADRIIAETNHGGEMIRDLISNVDSTVSYKAVHASRGKTTRAEPISALYEADQKRIHHCGVFPELETELTTWVPGDDSPNRLDALVWAFTELMLNDATELDAYESTTYSSL
jgi:hypothetical protein